MFATVGYKSSNVRGVHITRVPLTDSLRCAPPGYCPGVVLLQGTVDYRKVRRGAQVRRGAGHEHWYQAVDSKRHGIQGGEGGKN